MWRLKRKYKTYIREQVVWSHPGRSLCAHPGRKSLIKLGNWNLRTFQVSNVKKQGTNNHTTQFSMFPSWYVLVIVLS